MADKQEPIRRGWLTAARTWAQSATARVMAPWRQSRSTPDPSAVTNLADEWVSLLNSHVAPPITVQLRSAYETINGQPAPDSFDRSAYVRQYLQAAVNRMSGTPDQVYREITTQLTDGLEAGESPDQLAARVQGVLDVTGNAWWENRAATVGRTEAGAALNAGSLSGAAVLQDSTGRPLIKVWRADRDDRTRDAHWFADGQEQPLTAPFVVGGEALMYPLDPAGSAGNVINCRCTLKFRAG